MEMMLTTTARPNSGTVPASRSRILCASDVAARRVRLATAAATAVGSGQADKLSDIIAELEEIAARSGSPLLVAELACARPLLSGDDAAEALFVAALGQDLTTHPFLDARTLFSVGRWLRIQRRSADARAPLRESIELFDTLGAAQWSTRARQELRATG